MKVLIIGGVAGGASAAARLRRLYENAEITIFEKSGYVSFANCGLPYYIGNVIGNRENLLLETAESFKEKFNINVRINNEVLSIDRKNKEILVKDSISGKEYAEKYNRLLISTGAKPFVPPIKGLSENLYMSLRNIEDMDYIKNYINESKPRHAVVIGGGFIGLEMAENLVHAGINVTVIEKADQVMTPVDYEIASFIHQELKDNNVALYLKEDIFEIREDRESGEKIISSSSGEIRTDMIIMSIGVRPESKLALESGLRLTEKGYISVDEYLQTSDRDIFAIGDAVEINMPILNERLPVPLAAPANKQGRIAAANIAGKREKYRGTAGTAIAKVFNLSVSSTGLNEKTLKLKNLKYKITTIVKNSHAGYYPGAETVILKVLFNPDTGKIWGAQGVGKDGVDKRIDIISTAIFANLPIFELGDIDFAYAPPFNSAKDIVNYAAFMAKNIAFDKMEQVQWNELEGKNLLDIRTAEEYETGHIKDAKNIPLHELRNRLEELDKEKEYVVYCKVGARGYNAQRLLTSYGFKVLNLNGGTTVYNSAVKMQDNKISFKKSADSQKKGDENLDRLTDTFSNKADTVLDACGIQCPGPILKVKRTLDEMTEGNTVLVKATDASFEADIKAWTEKTGNTLLSISKKDGVSLALIKKGAALQSNVSVHNSQNISKKSTLVVFSGEFDKIFASLIIANGSLAMGNEVSMFFTFWGLNVLKKQNYKTPSKKSFLEKMFSVMLPKGPDRLPLSKMNFGGLGRKMIDFIMRKKNIERLDSLLNEFIRNGGKIIACTMSMDVMGIKKDELIDDIQYGGVAMYMGETENSSHNLFI